MATDRSITGDPFFFDLSFNQGRFSSDIGVPETAEDSLFTSDRIASAASGLADIGADIIQFKAIQSGLESQVAQLEENARIARFNADRTRVASDRIRTSMLETANNVIASNIVASYASGLRNSGSTAKANEAVRSQLDINRFFVFSDAEIKAQELERQAAFFEAQAREKREQAEDSFFGTFLGVVGTVAGVAAAFTTGGASLALTGVAVGSKIGKGFV